EVRKRKILRDDRPPTVGAKFDLCHGFQKAREVLFGAGRGQPAWAGAACGVAISFRACRVTASLIFFLADFKLRCAKSPVPLTNASAPAPAHSAAVAALMPPSTSSR